MVVAGIGGIAVGCYPENENLLLHSMGALAYFLFANVGLVALGRSAAGTAVRAKGLTMTLGVVGIAATILFFSGNYFGLGIGGTERLLVYPLPLAMILNGGLLLLDRGAVDVKATLGAG